MNIFHNLSITKVFHQFRDWIADLFRDWEIAEFVHICLRGAESVVRGTIFLRFREIRYAMGEIDRTFWIADRLARAEDGVGDHERRRLR